MELEGKQIAMLVADQFRDEEVFEPFDYLEEKGATVVLVGIERGHVSGKLGGKVEAEKSIREVSAEEFDAVVLPGGGAPEKLRLEPRVLEFVKSADRRGIPLAAICHGPQILISAGLLKGRRMTCYVGIRDDVKLAGAEYVDQEVVVDRNLITARHPGDIPAFDQAILAALATPAPTR